ncbi:WxL protein peptidoglycan domain-containing protein [Actinoplanes sp. G11-F43]|uniref:WxL protein peptidoglycan domain-containing protein n=1 Tax=Actinoplanes sp. G11-F43 TaxID=3424130 RepID=UPI003D333CD4
MRTRNAVAALALALGVLVPPAPAAADSLTWSVAPSGPRGPNGRPALDYKLDPGAAITDHVAVTNHAAEPLTLRLYATDALTTAGGGFGLLAGDAKAVDAGSWVKPSRSTLTLPASSRVVVPFTVTVPDNATPGDHAAGLVASLAADVTDGNGNRVTVDHRVGTRVYLRVAGPLTPKLTISDVRVKAATSWNPLTLPRVTASFTVTNTGNVRLTGTPSTRVEGPFGLSVRTATAAAIPEILPGGSVSTAVTLDAVPPLFHEYVISEIMPAPADGRPIDPAPARITDTRTLWLIPWSQLAVLGLVIALTAAWLFARRRRRTRMGAALAAAEQRGREQATSSDSKGTS